MNKEQYIILLALMILIVSSCTQKEPNIYIPKPRAYPRIDRTDSLMLYMTDDFKIYYSSDATLTPVNVKQQNQRWFNLEYSRFNAILFCSYIKIRNTEFEGLMEDNQKLLNSYFVDNVIIQESAYTNLEQRAHGALYYLDGNAIAPYQFYLTDSTSYFLRGSLYYNEVVQTDSILPTTLSLRKDIVNLMESFENRSAR